MNRKEVFFFPAKEADIIIILPNSKKEKRKNSIF